MTVEVKGIKYELRIWWNISYLLNIRYREVLHIKETWRYMR